MPYVEDEDVGRSETSHQVETGLSHAHLQQPQNDYSFGGDVDADESEDRDADAHDDEHGEDLALRRRRSVDDDYVCVLLSFLL